MRKTCETVGAMDDLERFMSYTKRDPESGCLLWTGGLNEQGYGQFWVDGRNTGAHRWIFGEKYGYLPPVVMHRCDTPNCVDWERCLIAGSLGENNTDRYRKGRNSDRRGMANPACKLTDAQVERLCEDCASGKFSRREIAELYGITPGHVSYLVNGHRGKRGHHRVTRRGTI
jgi:hypothetical protein